MSSREIGVDATQPLQTPVKALREPVGAVLIRQLHAERAGQLIEEEAPRISCRQQPVADSRSSRRIEPLRPSRERLESRYEEDERLDDGQQLHRVHGTRAVLLASKHGAQGSQCLGLSRIEPVALHFEDVRTADEPLDNFDAKFRDEDAFFVECHLVALGEK